MISLPGWLHRSKPKVMVSPTPMVAPRSSMGPRQADLRQAINAISDAVQNRPRPLRQFDQIHMKSGDMVLQSEIVAD